MIRHVGRFFKLFLSENKTISGPVQKQGMKAPTSFARQFVADESLDEAMAEIKSLEIISKGKHC